MLGSARSGRCYPVLGFGKAAWAYFAVAADEAVGRFPDRGTLSGQASLVLASLVLAALAASSARFLSGSYVSSLFHSA